MTDQLTTLSKMFSERIFRIPDYQRGYAWGQKEVTDFWNDLSRLGNEKNHYAGVITIEPVEADVFSAGTDDIWLIKSKQYKPFFIVDGQQRLTTAMILIVSVLDVMADRGIEQLNYSKYHEIQSQFLFKSKDENKSRSFLFSYQLNNPSYCFWISSILNQTVETAYNNEETSYTHNLEEAKNFFIERLEKFSIEELEQLYIKITQHLLFNVYEIVADIDVFVAFETMNNRGKPLSHLELLKNRLIYLSTLINESEDIKTRIRRNVNNCWKDIYHCLGRNKAYQLSDDEFLNTHFHA